MSKQWLSGFIGILLLGSAICFGSAKRGGFGRQRRKRDVSVEDLADELKSAWGDRHTA